MQNIVDSIDTKLVARLWYRNFPQGKDTAGKRTQGFVYAEEFESNNEYTSVEDYVMRLTADRLNTTE
jgi:hypothetical protein